MSEAASIPPSEPQATVAASQQANDVARRVAEHYQVERSLGRGGMAEVFEVVDCRTGKKLALKRLIQRAELAGAREGLFRREYHALSQLSHPSTVRVYEYGLDGGTPYYTMEHLVGEDLASLAPLPWQRVTQMLCDVASALSLVHSRRLVHRDVSPRNVFCTNAGAVKLIDFGALAVMGPSQQVVGTPPCCSPEVVNLQPLDARADLFSLGATFYCALTGRNAYPARSFSLIRDAWLSRIQPPSAVVPAIPEALDTLILDLLRLDPEARPRSAMEVIERARAISCVPARDGDAVFQSYLSTPTLVGRNAQVTLFARRVMRAMDKRGSCLLVSGPAGSGRTRLLDASVLEAKLVGCAVARADSSDAGDGFGVASALLRRMVEASPQLMAEMPDPLRVQLAHLHPALLDGRPKLEASDLGGSVSRRVALVGALRDWVFDAARTMPMAFVVDDVDRIDEPSLAWLALAADGLKRRSLLLVASRGTELDGSEALRLLERSATSVPLGALDRAESAQLIESLFGRGPRSDTLASQLHAIAEGWPRALMELAQHLVDTGVVRYDAGAWVLPETLGTADLPPSLTAAFAERLRSQGPKALELAQALALSPELRFTFDECAGLLETADERQLAGVLDTLGAIGAVVPVGSAFAFSQAGWIEAARSTTSPDKLPELHLRMANVLERRAYEGVRCVQHLFAAGRLERAVDVAVEYSRQTREQTDRDPNAWADVLGRLPLNWEATLARAIEECEVQERPAFDALTIQQRISGIAPVAGVCDATALSKLMDMLARAVGLDLYPTVDEEPEPAKRIAVMFARAQARFESIPERQRLLPPQAALKPLGQAVVEAVGLFANTVDFDLHDTIADLTPVAPLSPALTTIRDLAAASRTRGALQVEEGIRGYQAVVDRLMAPDGGGLEATHRRYATFGCLNGLALQKAGLGMASALDIAERIASGRMMEANGLRIRMVYELWTGNTMRAERIRRELQRLSIEQNAASWNVTGHLLRELAAYAVCDDLTMVRDLVEECAALAKRFHSWGGTHAYALGEYCRIRGDWGGALASFERALASGGAGRSHCWPFAASGYAKTLLAMGDAARAVETGERLLAEALTARMGVVSVPMYSQLVEAHAALGNFERAVESATAGRLALETAEVSGLFAMQLDEAETHLAIARADAEAFESAISRCAASMRHGKSRALSAKYERLVQKAVGAGLLREPQRMLATEDDARGSSLVVRALKSIFEATPTREERAAKALDLLVEDTRSSGGALYYLTSGTLERIATAGEFGAPADLDDIARRHIDVELNAGDDLTCCETVTLMASREESSLEGARVHPFLLGHTTNGAATIAGVVVLIGDEASLYVAPTWLDKLSREACDLGDASALQSKNG